MGAMFGRRTWQSAGVVNLVEEIENSGEVGLTERADFCSDCRCITVHHSSSYPEGKLVWFCSLCGIVSDCIREGGL